MVSQEIKKLLLSPLQEELLKEHTRHQKNVNKKNQEIKELLQEVSKSGYVMQCLGLLLKLTLPTQLQLL